VSRRATCDQGFRLPNLLELKRSSFRKALDWHEILTDIVPFRRFHELLYDHIGPKYQQEAQLSQWDALAGSLVRLAHKIKSIEAVFVLWPAYN